MVPLALSFALFDLFLLPDVKERFPYKPYDGTAIVYELEISPSKGSKSLLKFELTPPFAQRKPGNAAAAFEAATRSLPEPLTDREEQFRKEMRMSDWRNMRPQALLRDRLKHELKPYQQVIDQAHQAALLKTYEFTDPHPLTVKSVNTQLASKLRKLMDPLNLQVKVDLGAGRFDEGVKSIQAIYRLGECLCSGPNMLTLLVGIAMTAIGHNASVDWISTPNSPNLYWAFATRKRPLLDPRPMLVGEAEITADMFKIFKECDRDPMTEEEIKSLQVKGKEMLEMLDIGERLANALFNEAKFKSHRTKLGFVDPDSVTDDAGGEIEEGLVHGEGPVPADAESAELVQPTEGAFDDPADVPEAWFTVSASGNLRSDAEPSQDGLKRAAVESLVGHEGVRLLRRPTRLSCHRRGVDNQWQGRSDIVGIGRGDLDDQGDAVGVGQQAMLGAASAAIGGIRAGFCPPNGALTELVSITARDQSSWSAVRNRARNR